VEADPRITDEPAKLIFYYGFIDGALDAPRSLQPEVHRLYFEPEYPEFSAWTMWSLSPPSPARSNRRDQALLLIEAQRRGGNVIVAHGPAHRAIPRKQIEGTIFWCTVYGLFGVRKENLE
jgi:hypothetical protein